MNCDSCLSILFGTLFCCLDFVFVLGTKCKINTNITDIFLCLYGHIIWYIYDVMAFKGWMDGWMD